eukprot:scaffold84136_cov57-Phaeocystis_antarctica.AAC.1
MRRWVRTPLPAAARTPLPAAARTPLPAAARTPPPAAARTPPPAAARTPPLAAARRAAWCGMSTAARSPRRCTPHPLPGSCSGRHRSSYCRRAWLDLARRRRRGAYLVGVGVRVRARVRVRVRIRARARARVSAKAKAWSVPGEGVERTAQVRYVESTTAQVGHLRRVGPRGLAG